MIPRFRLVTHTTLLEYTSYCPCIHATYTLYELSLSPVVISLAPCHSPHLPTLSAQHHVRIINCLLMEYANTPSMATTTFTLGWPYILFLYLNTLYSYKSN